MPKANRDITGKIISFLREKDGETEIGLNEAAKKFNSHPGTVSRIFKRLIECGVIERTADPDLTGTKRPARYALNDQFREGDSWREALKRKPSQPAPAPAKTSHEACHSEECLRARKVLLEELVGVHERLKASQEENQILRSTVEELQNRVKDLEGEIQSRSSACHKLRDDVNRLDARLRTLRSQTSKLPPPVTAKKLMADGFGVVTLPSEGLPDTHQ